MGVDARAKLNSKWEVRSLVTVLENRCDVKVKVESCHKTSAGMFHLFCTRKDWDYGVTLTLFLSSKDALGTNTHLMANTNEHSCFLLKSLVERFGGLFAEEDCSGTWQEFVGDFNDDDGVAFHLREATLKRKSEGKPDLMDVEEQMVEFNNWLARK